MEYFLAAAAITALLYLLGLGWTWLLIPRASPSELLIASPWIGYCYASFAIWNVYYFGAILSRSWLAIVLTPPLLALAFCVYKRRAQLSLTDGWLSPLAALILGGFSFINLSCSVLLLHQGMTTISLGNHDIALYAGVSRFLTEFSRSSVSGLNRDFVTVMDVNYFGAPAFTALACVLLGKMPDQLSTLCTNLLVPLTACGVFLLLRQVLRLGWKIGLVGTGIAAFHPLIQYIALHGFCSQIAGMGLSVMMFWAWARLPTTPGVARFRSGYFVLLVVFTLGLFLTYQHMLPFVWFFIGVYSVGVNWPIKQWKVVTEPIVANGAAFILVVLLCPQRLLALYLTLRGTATVNGGWFLRLVTPDYLVGLTYDDVFLVTRSAAARGAVSAAVVILLLSWFVLACRRGQRPVIAATIACAGIYAGALVLGFSGREHAVLGGYKSFKLISFFLPFFSMIFAAFFAIDLLPSRWLSRTIKVACLLTLAQAYAVAGLKLTRTVVYDGAHVEASYRDLLKLDADRSITSINIMGTNWWSIMWRAYFLMHKDLSFATSTYYAATPLTGTYDLTDSRNASNPRTVAGILNVEDIATAPTPMAPAIEISDRFSLWKHSTDNGGALTAALGTGWWGSEGNHIWSGAAGKSSNIDLMARGPLTVSVRISYFAWQQLDSLTVILNDVQAVGEPSSKENDLQHIELPLVNLHQGLNELQFRSALPPAPAPKGDPRLLSHSFVSIDIQVR